MGEPARDWPRSPLKEDELDKAHAPVRAHPDKAYAPLKAQPDVSHDTLNEDQPDKSHNQMDRIRAPPPQAQPDKADSPPQAQPDVSHAPQREDPKTQFVNFCRATSYYIRVLIQGDTDMCPIHEHVTGDCGWFLEKLDEWHDDPPSFPLYEYFNAFINHIHIHVTPLQTFRNCTVELYLASGRSFMIRSGETTHWQMDWVQGVPNRAIVSVCTAGTTLFYEIASRKQIVVHWRQSFITVTFIHPNLAPLAKARLWWGGPKSSVNWDHVKGNS